MDESGLDLWGKEYEFEIAFVEQVKSGEGKRH